MTTENSIGFEDEAQNLSAQQMIALEAILSGMSDVEAAQRAECCRQTIWRWRNADPAFMAARNRGRAESLAAVSSSLIETAENAVRVVDQQIQAGDGKLAFKVLTSLGLLAPRVTSVGPLDPRRIALELAKGERQLRQDERDHAFNEELEPLMDELAGREAAGDLDEEDVDDPPTASTPVTPKR